MDLSIIIPMYNAEHTLERCIRSIESQDCSYNYEIIIIDDGSTDNSLLKMEKLSAKYKNIRIFRQSNLKQSAARNNGLSHSNGKYIMFFDIDDVIEPMMLTRMIELMSSGNDMVMCGIKKIYEKSVYIENNTCLSKARNKRQLISNYLTNNKEFDVGLWNKIYKAKIIKNHNIKFENGDFFEDSLFVLKYLYYCDSSKLVYLPECFYDLYKHFGSTTGSYNKKIDFWADEYVNKVDIFLKKRELKLDDNIWNAFRSRIKMHIVHHHIKFDDNWNARKQNGELSFLSISKLFMMRKYLSTKYYCAVIIARFLPKIYIRMYRYRNLKNNK